MRPHLPRTVRCLLRSLAAGAAATLLLGTAAPGQTAAEPTLREAAERTGRFVGTAVADGRLGDAAYRTIAAREFGSVTAENAMKWGSVEPQRGRFDWAAADRLVEFAEANGQRVHGHTLVWHSQLPGWLENGSFSDTELRTLMVDHVTEQVGRYRGRVQRWDVVNEALNEDGSLRRSIFHRQLGESYIADAFRAARAADPGAGLFINDYNTEGLGAKSDGMYRLVQRLLQQGVPIDGVGFQSHLVAGQVPASMRANLQRFADLGLEVVVTELDVRMQLPADDDKLRRQAQDYRSVAEACLAVPRCTGITVWGFSDRDSWVPDVFEGQGAACPYDGDYRPKPAYFALRDAFAAAGGPGGPGDPGDPGACTAAFTVANRWSTGSVVSVSVRTEHALDGWRVEFDLPPGVSVADGWNGGFSQSDRHVTVANAPYNGAVAAGGTLSFGFRTGGGPAMDGTPVSLDGAECAAG